MFTWGSKEDFFFPNLPCACWLYLLICVFHAPFSSSVTLIFCSKPENHQQWQKIKKDRFFIDLKQLNSLRAYVVLIDTVSGNTTVLHYKGLHLPVPGYVYAPWISLSNGKIGLYGFCSKKLFIYDGLIFLIFCHSRKFPPIYVASIVFSFILFLILFFFFFACLLME